MIIDIDTFLEPRMCANLAGMPAIPFIDADDQDRVTRRDGRRA